MLGQIEDQKCKKYKASNIDNVKRTTAAQIYKHVSFVEFFLYKPQHKINPHYTTNKEKHWIIIHAEI